MTLKPLISVVFTCRGRPYLTELCLKRFKELMPEPYELAIAYDGADDDYMLMLYDVAEPEIFVPNYKRRSRFALINRALDLSRGEFYMHVENDFYWQDSECLGVALNALGEHPEIDYIRFEYLPFQNGQFRSFYEVDGRTIAIMKETTPFRFTFNPHIRREKFPCGRFKEGDFTKQPEQHHNDTYKGTSACMSGKNFRHLGIYDEGGHFKPWYAERFTLVRGMRSIDDPLKEFNKFCDIPEYVKLFRRYLDNR